MNIQAALAAGYSAKKLLNMISRIYPELGSRVQNIAAAGYAADEILNLVGKLDKKGLNKFKKGKKGSAVEPYPEEDNPLIAAQRAHQQQAQELKQNNPALTMGKLAATAAGAYALSHLGLPAAASLMQPSIEGTGEGSKPWQRRPEETTLNPNNPVGFDQQQQLGYEPPPEGAMTTPYNPYEPKPRPPSQEPAIEQETFGKYEKARGQPPQPQSEPEKIPEKKASIQSLLNEVLTPGKGSGESFKKLMSELTKEQVGKVFDQFGMRKMVDKMAEKFTPEEIGKSLYSPGLEKALGIPFTEAIVKYLSNSAGQVGKEQGTQPAAQPVEQVEPSLPQESPPLEQPPVEPTKPEAIKQEEKPVKKTTYLPSGDLGKVLSEKNGIAKIEVDGKIKHRKVEDLLETEKTPEELADLYEEAYFSIPKHLRSSNLFCGGYDAETNRFAYLPHGGSLYTYDDVPDDLAKKIKELLVTAKTSGRSAWGMWSEDDPSRGAAMSAAIEELKTRQKRKAEEKSKLTGKKEPVEKEYSGKFEPVHAPFQPQQKIVQKRHREREKLKRQKKEELYGEENQF